MKNGDVFPSFCASRWKMIRTAQNCCYFANTNPSARSSFILLPVFVAILLRAARPVGAQYGGGQVTLGLPDLRGRVAVGQGQGPDAAAVQMGEVSGSNTTTMTLSGAGSCTRSTAVDNNGSGQPVSMPVSVSGQTSLMQPYTGVNYIICLQGIFPSRQ
jgi:microcystin-dependent protein